MGEYVSKLVFNRAELEKFLNLTNGAEVSALAVNHEPDALQIVIKTERPVAKPPFDYPMTDRHRAQGWETPIVKLEDLEEKGFRLEP